MDEYLRLTPAPGGAVSERMQALLSKAVEEQVHEQREVQSLLADVRTALATVQRDALTAPGGQDDVRRDLAAHAEDTRSRLAQLDDRLQAIVGAVSTSAQVLQGISAQLERLVEAGRDQASNAGRSEPLAQIRYEVAELRTRIDSAAEQTAATVASHVDNAVLVLAEALLRRPAGSSPGGDAPTPTHAMPAAPPAVTYAEPAPEPDRAPKPDRAPEPDDAVEPVVQAAEPVAEAAPVVDDDDPLFGASFRVAPSADDDDEAGGLVDDERAVPTAASTLESGAPYDDPLGDLPSADEPRPEFPLAAAPYDLERALFGDRSRPVAEPEEAAVAPQEPAAVDDSAEEPPVVAMKDSASDDDEHLEDGEEPRRRPWWRPSN